MVRGWEHRVTVLPCGDSALTVQFDDQIDATINNAVLQLRDRLAEQRERITAVVPSYRSLLVAYNPIATAFETLKSEILSTCRSLNSRPRASRLWEIPVVYGGTFGIDLAALSAKKSMTAAAVIGVHAAARYRVYMVGFVPGFAYLGELHSSLFSDRLSVPRAATPPGSITIGGMQTAITSIEAPSGWLQIGRTPVRLFKPDRDPICLLEAGDEVTFKPISAEEWPALALRAHSGEVVARRLQ